MLSVLAANDAAKAGQKPLLASARSMRDADPSIGIGTLRIGTSNTAAISAHRSVPATRPAKDDPTTAARRARKTPQATAGHAHLRL